MTDAEAHAVVSERMPDGLFTGDGPVEVHVDKDEILIVGAVDPEGLPDADDPGHEAAAEERIDEFRAATREARITFARSIERRTGRKVSWGARCGELGLLFTHLNVPVMSRLRLREREVLDTLVAAGVSRSRSDALAWCVRRVRDDQAEWLSDIREAFDAVAKVREQGPDKA